MKPLTGTKLTFTKGDLASFDLGQKKVLYTFAHILNRTKLLEAQVFSHWQDALNPARSQIEQAAALFGVLEFLIILAGDLKEGWEAVQSCYFATQVSKTLNPRLSPEVQQALKRLGAYFSGDGVINRLRNNFAYHHSPDKVVSTAEALPDDDTHTSYLFEQGNNYFHYATEVRIAAVAEELKLDDWNQTIQVLVEEVTRKVYADFSMVLNAVLAALIESVAHQRTKAELPSVPSDKELSTTYFFYVEPPAA